MIINLLCLVIVSGELDISFFFDRIGNWEYIFGSILRVSVRRLYSPGLCSARKEIGVVLAVDLFQFDGGVGGFFQGAASEEIGGIIIVTQHIPFRFFHYGGKLLQVTNHQQLYASKGFVSVPIPAEYGVDGIQQICPHLYLFHQ